MNKYALIWIVGLICTLILTFINTGDFATKTSQLSCDKSLLSGHTFEDIKTICWEAIIDNKNKRSELHAEQQTLEELNDWYRSIILEKKDSMSDWLEDLGIKQSKKKDQLSDLAYMDTICEKSRIHWNVSPLCWDKELYKRLEAISDEVWVPFDLMLWMSQAESHVLANFKPAHCKVSNNPAWLKWYNKDGKTVYGKFPDADGCWVYRFRSIESWRLALAHTIKNWYIDRWCSTPECISKYWVKNDWLIKHGRVARVNTFYGKKDLAYNN